MKILDFIKNCNSLLLVDGIEDVRNFGSMIRSAAILGYRVLYRKSKGCYITDTVTKVSKGGVDHTMVMEITNYVQVLDVLKKNGFWILCLDEKGKDILTKFEKVCIIIGSEAKGASRLSKELADYMWKLKTNGTMTTFNASIAASIGMYVMLGDKNE